MKGESESGYSARTLTPYEVFSGPRWELTLAAMAFLGCATCSVCQCSPTPAFSSAYDAGQAADLQASPVIHPTNIGPVSPMDRCIFRPPTLACQERAGE
ncbi:hypothetical protein LY78DRAFT_324848 [Colletotrichum sublineola]|nr:hypothetical protein LY78DRAFT_324848 [Colletotrichum sublineola]